MKDDTLQVMADLLLELEREMRQSGLWSEQPPTAEALRSMTPFAADYLDLEQWLQWIFIPQIKLMIEADMPLPERCEIHPYAEERMKQLATSTTKLLDLINKIDRHISNS